MRRALVVVGCLLAGCEPSQPAVTAPNLPPPGASEQPAATVRAESAAAPAVPPPASAAPSSSAITLQQTRDHLAAKGEKLTVEELAGKKSLYAPNQDLDDNDTRYLQPLVELEKLDLSGNPRITDSGLENLRFLPKLTWLNLGRIPFTAAGLAHVCTRTELEELFLSGSSLPDDALSCLGNLPRLRKVSLSETKATDKALAMLAKLPAMKDVNVLHTAVTDNGLAALEGNPRLRGFLATGIGDKGATSLQSCTALEGLTLSQGALTDKGAKALGKLTSLSSLDLADNKLTDAGVAHLKGLVKLKVLDLSGNSLTDKALRHLEGMKELISVELKKTKVTQKGVDALKKKLPKCNIGIE